MEVQEKDLVVWVETQPPVMSVCFRTCFYIAGIIDTRLYVCIYTYVYMYMLIHTCIYECMWIYVFTESPQISNKK